MIGYASAYVEVFIFVGLTNGTQAAFTTDNRKVLQAAIGMAPGKIEENRARFQQLFADNDGGRTARAQVQRLIRSQDIEFSASDLELGYRYEDGALVEDGTPSPPTDPLGQQYVPTTRPGNRLPHAWLTKGNETVSTHDLVATDGNFCLITDEQGQSWVSVVEQLKGSLNIVCAQISSDAQRASCEYLSKDGNWNKLRGIESGGAILVRPDNFVAWRLRKPSTQGGKELVEALQLILGKSALVSARL